MHRILLMAGLLIACASGQAADSPAASEEPSLYLSVASTTTVNFIGKDFLLKEKATDQSVAIYEFFLSDNGPPAWTELVDFRVYPVNPDGNEPKDHAARTAMQFKKQYPNMQFALYESKVDGAVLLDFFLPRSARKDGKFLEFNAFKFYKDPEGGTTMSFHYAKNIEGDGDGRTISAVSSDIKNTRAELIPAMAAFPLYRQ